MSSSSDPQQQSQTSLSTNGNDVVVCQILTSMVSECTDSSVKFWLSEGLPSEKPILGVPLYGRTFALDSAKQNTIGSSASGQPWSGPYTGEPGFGNQWVGYDDELSVRQKAELAKELNLGGAMVWSIETDDFLGKCGSKYPLLYASNQVLRGDPDKTTTTTQHTTITTNTPTTKKTTTTARTTTTLTSTTDKPSGKCDLTCKKPGFLRDCDNCAKFYRCVPDLNGYRRFEFTCQPGTVSDLEISVCNWPDGVDCSICA
ncbi:hypothetical protein QAD02_024454 [Eretmocerus hayati]|uniref:Uncharacterized protein n=1 Tax=Eretmocerus hayati TaxID=131215 RepID=A0ACC2PYI8_9HYME|nr:hypothetical protein QAD02_024454 [Eretmocerus hayati]